MNKLILIISLTILLSISVHNSAPARVGEVVNLTAAETERQQKMIYNLEQISQKQDQLIAIANENKKILEGLLDLQKQQVQLVGGLLSESQNMNMLLQKQQQPQNR